MERKKTVLVFEAHESAPDILICRDSIPQITWEELNKEDAVRLFDRVNLEAKFHCILPPYDTPKHDDWYYKHAAIELLRSLGFIVKVQLFRDNPAGGYTSEEVYKPAETEEKEMKTRSGLTKEEVFRAYTDMRKTYHIWKCCKHGWPRQYCWDIYGMDEIGIDIVDHNDQCPYCAAERKVKEEEEWFGNRRILKACDFDSDEEYNEYECGF